MTAISEIRQQDKEALRLLNEKIGPSNWQIQAKANESGIFFTVRYSLPRRNVDGSFAKRRKWHYWTEAERDPVTCIRQAARAVESYFNGTWGGE